MTTLQLQLSVWEQGFLVRKRTAENLEAYEYRLRGLEQYFRYTKDSVLQARKLLEKAIELDPNEAAAYVTLSGTYLIEWVFQWSQDPQAFDKAFACAQKAVALDDTLPNAHRLLAIVYPWKKQYDQAIAEAERAIALAPSDADMYDSLAVALNSAGRPEEAIAAMKKAMRLNPHYQLTYLIQLGTAYRLTGHTEEAIAIFKKALLRNPNFLGAHGNLADIYAELGQEEEARAEAAEVLRLSPNFSLEGARQRLHYKDPAIAERIITNLRKAGLK
ncbi:MAG TPA: tetratricopeptide repeat protein [Candidatus Binatia bacterium]|nr:tetratricopeptide repeat protein [Candidatus Binatia bacterium]